MDNNVENVNTNPSESNQIQQENNSNIIKQDNPEKDSIEVQKDAIKDTNASLESNEPQTNTQNDIQITSNNDIQNGLDEKSASNDSSIDKNENQNINQNDISQDSKSLNSAISNQNNDINKKEDTLTKVTSIPTIEQGVQDFINNTQAMSAERINIEPKSAFEKLEFKYRFMIILFLASLFFIFVIIPLFG